MRARQPALPAGGGVEACESATWLHGLGAEAVTVIERGSRLLRRLEPFAGELVADRFTERGMRVLTGATVEAVTREDVTDPGEGSLHGGPSPVRPWRATATPGEPSS